MRFRGPKPLWYRALMKRRHQQQTAAWRDQNVQARRAHRRKFRALHPDREREQMAKANRKRRLR